MNKKIYFTILLLALRLTINSQCSDIVVFPDLNFKSVLINQTSPLIDTNQDGEIQCIEANNFRGTIDVSDKSISDLTGIEAFPNITILACNNNNLNSIDISSNTSLQRLFCNNNSIRNINLSNNKNLITIDLERNELRDLNLENNTDLLAINIKNNFLTNLILDKNIKLSVINCRDNNIASLDLSKNNELEVVLCDFNELTTLNLSNGNNTLIRSFSSTNNSNLNCIQIDENFTPPNTWRKDSNTSFNTDCQATANIEDYLKTNITIYPNPAKNKLKIQSDININSIKLYNSLGKEIGLYNNSDEIDVSNLSHGMYLLVVKTEKSKTYKRFIKK
ncbi:T9SS type A sorting domain-containing protein [uncultured Tenacibaculum sp.]|uniref:T9SS type A sorting domain-containing protein n=1 Tax=uncultured Tenacibaculum sp. TaxID=174713 RepID=UPI0026256D14|nr:T9SS type A sorting domain-containing protein [uncultured Tenacibaculum sp.]